MRILVVNTGSSSLKLSVLTPDGDVQSSTAVERWEGEDDLGRLEGFLGDVGTIDAVGHRVVHGGDRYDRPSRVTDDLIDYVASIEHLAPKHNPRAGLAMRMVGELLPSVPAVACFDTSFHASLTPAAAAYALPRAWNERWGLRRYGFHGLSHAYAVRRGAEIAGAEYADARIVSCHLGAGASLAAVRGGVCVDTTMGFTPLEGLVMTTRSGSVDPGLLLWLLRHGGLDVDGLSDGLQEDGGLRGLSGTSGDVRDVLAGAESGDEDCRLALSVFNHRLRREIAAMTAAIGGLDVLVMTGGIGEHAWQVREAVAGSLGFLGVALDEGTNRRATQDADISVSEASARTVVVTAREDIEIAAQVRDVVEGGPAGERNRDGR